MVRQGDAAVKYPHVLHGANNTRGDEHVTSLVSVLARRRAVIRQSTTPALASRVSLCCVCNRDWRNAHDAMTLTKPQNKRRRRAHRSTVKRVQEGTRRVVRWRSGRPDFASFVLDILSGTLEGGEMERSVEELLSSTLVRMPLWQTALPRVHLRARAPANEAITQI